MRRDKQDEENVMEEDGSIIKLRSDFTYSPCVASGYLIFFVDTNFTLDLESRIDTYRFS